MSRRKNVGEEQKEGQRRRPYEIHIINISANNGRGTTVASRARGTGVTRGEAGKSKSGKELRRGMVDLNTSGLQSDLSKTRRYH